MCTAILEQTPGGTVYFGRTMDFSYPLNSELYAVPRGLQWNNMLNTHKIRNKYSIMAIGQDVSPVIFADGFNEAGFAAAVLYFPGYADYDIPASETTRTPPVAALELVNFLLGQCTSVEQALSTLRAIQIVGVQDSVTDSIAPLHWIIADKSGRCAVVEKTAGGLQLMNNPIGVLSNSPDFQWHMTNLRNYMNVTQTQSEESMWGHVNLMPFGQGTGTFGLPGDYTPPSRFVRTAYLKTHTPLPENDTEAVMTCFHLLESVSIPKGAVITDRGTPDYTQYTAFMNLTAGEYFFRTYANSQITSMKFPAGLNNSSELMSLGPLAEPAYSYSNTTIW